MEDAMSGKVWFITGATRGFGASIARAALAAGDQVAGTGRDSGAVERALGAASAELLPLAMDVRDAAQVDAAVKAAEARFGRIDVLVNNAGYGQMGAFEEISVSEIDEQFQTNVFGLFAVTRAVLPIMRRQREGRIFNFSSMVGYIGRPRLSVYAASKFAVQGFSEALAAEVAPLGIKVTVVEPGIFRTDFQDPSSIRYGEIAIDDYAEASAAMKNLIFSTNHKQPGDPDKLAQAVLTLAECDAPPVHFPVGSDAVQRFADKHAAVDRDVAQWRDLSLATAYDSV
jgi:NAD(P)-dependent dehydrogenase (short-subunit alcohol dehydrogenase family)